MRFCKNCSNILIDEKWKTVCEDCYKKLSRNCNCYLCECRRFIPFYINNTMCSECSENCKGKPERKCTNYECNKVYIEEAIISYKGKRMFCFDKFCKKCRKINNECFSYKIPLEFVRLKNKSTHRLLPILKEGFCYDDDLEIIKDFL